MSWNSLGDAGWTAVVAAVALTAGSAVRGWFSLRRYQIGQQSETDRFTRALEGSDPDQRPEIIRAYRELDRTGEDPVVAVPDDEPVESAARSLLARLLPARPKE